MRLFNRSTAALLVALALTAAPAFAQGTTPQTHDEFLAAGNTSYAENKLDKAVAEFAESIKMRNDSSVAYLMRGTALLAKKDYAAAIADFTKALELNKYEYLALQRRAEALDKLNRKPEAEADKALAKSRLNELAAPRTAEEWYDKAVYLEDRSEWMAAIDAYDACLKLNPAFKKAFSWKSVYERRGDLNALTFEPEGAAKDYAKALEASPNSIELHLKRGRALAQLSIIQDTLDEALKEYTYVIDRAPDLKRMPEWLVEAYSARAGIYFDKEDDAATLKDLNAALALDPKHLQSLLTRGTVYRFMNKPDDALLDFNRYIELGGKAADAFASRALILSGRKQLDLALADYDRALELAPHIADFWNQRGIVHFRKENWAKAFADFDKAVSLNAKFAVALGNRGAAHAKLGNWDAALADYTATLALDPKDANALRNRAIAYRKLNKPDLATADEAKLKELEPNPAN